MYQVNSRLVIVLLMIEEQRTETLIDKNGEMVQ